MAEVSPDHSGTPAFSWKYVDWVPFTAIALLHVACLAAPFYFSWSALGVAILFWWIAGGLGVCLCYHRLLTHRSFKTPKPVEYALTAMGCLNLQGGPIKWVGTHRIHHKESDTDLDPHSPKHGFDWAHVLWCVVKDPYGRDLRRYAPDLLRDRGMVWLDKYFWVPQVAVAVALYAIGGLPWLIWGVAVRTVFTYHATWFVNSASHTWGYRNFDTREESRNLWWVSLLSFGEGWHNNHHAYPRSAAHGLRRLELDPTYWTIKAMSWIGLARDIHVPQIALEQARGGQS
jgi:stearoyl-CoA desaturase (delta-9 desaturase)